MLITLRLRNFRGFGDHVLPFRDRTWVVGRNNAGKTTLIAALTLVSRVTNRWGRLQSRQVPEWLEDVPVGTRGVSPAVGDLRIAVDTLFHHYGAPPALLEAEFCTGDRVHVYVGPDAEIWATAVDQGGRTIPTHGAGATRRLPRIAVLPQVAPLQEDEKILDAKYVRRSAGTAAASLHFRNQLFRDLVHHDYWDESDETGDHYQDFKRLAEATWPELQLLELIWKPGHVGSDLRLNVRDADFVAEAGRMGHGLQMWLQVMWFLARSVEADIVVLDEPEVYTHAEVQHRLVRVLLDRPNAQVIVATHSVEILTDVTPEDVLVVDRGQPRSGFAGSIPGLQKAMERLGGLGSLPLTKLWAARRVLLVEGDDIDYLALFHQALFPRALQNLRALPRVPLGGWSGFSYAVGGGMLLQNAADEAIIPYCILDSDYHTEAEIEERYAEAARAGVELHIWSRKEIESYVLVPSAIRRVLVQRSSSARVPDEEEIAKELDRIAESKRNDVTDRIAEACQHRNRAWGPPRANKAAREHVERAWITREGRWGICNAKELHSELSEWSRKICGVTFGPMAVAYRIRDTELAPEVRGLVTAIERAARLSR